MSSPYGKEIRRNSHQNYIEVRIQFNNLTSQGNVGGAINFRF